MKPYEEIEMNHSDEQRVVALRRYEILDTPGEATFDIITALLSDVLKVPHACVSLVDSDRVWFKSAFGVEAPEVPRETGFCSSLVRSDDEILHIEDARINPNTRNNSLVCGAPWIRFYAGAPLSTPEGHRIGTLCAFGPDPRRVSETEFAMLKRLAGLVMNEIELRKTQRALQRTEAALRQSQRLESIGLVASGVAHDFNNLLTVILGTAELLKRELRSPRGWNLLSTIETTGQRAADLVGQVLAYAGRGQDSAMVPLDLNALIQETARMIGVSVGVGVSVSLDLSADLPSVNGHPTSLRQLVMNLLTNAAEASSALTGAANVTLATRLSPSKRSIILTIRDEGPGMTEDVLERIFEPFYSSKPGGRGLGLAICHRIVEQHGGEIEVTSNLGQGTEFKVKLSTSEQPAAFEAVDGIENTADTTRESQGLVLVVDDEPTICELAQRCLESAGYGVLLAGGGAEAIELLDQNHRDLSVVVLDWCMPDVNGKQVLAAMSSRRMDLPVVLTSGHSEQDVQEAFHSYSIASFLPKPFPLEDLVGRVKAAQASC